MKEVEDVVTMDDMLEGEGIEMTKRMQAFSWSRKGIELPAVEVYDFVSANKWGLSNCNSVVKLPDWVLSDSWTPKLDIYCPLNRFNGYDSVEGKGGAWTFDLDQMPCEFYGLPDNGLGLYSFLEAVSKMLSFYWERDLGVLRPEQVVFIPRKVWGYNRATDTYEWILAE